jgi:hypothetical protein
MLPDYITRAYKEIPADCPVSVLIRHSIRFPINSEAEVWTAGLTDEGKALACELGAWLSQRYEIDRIESSPIERCVDTGRYIASSLPKPIPVSPVKVLAHPNEQGEYDSFDQFFLNKTWPLRIQDMAAYLIPNGRHRSGLNIFISHDTTLLTMVGYWLQKDFRDLSVWPNYLEPFFMWWQDGALIARFREEQRVVDPLFMKKPVSHLFPLKTINQS